MSELIPRYPSCANEAVVKDVVDWTLGSKDVLRVDSVEHEEAGNATGQLPPSKYRIKDEIVSEEQSEAD